MSVNNETQNLAAGATIEKTLPAGGVYVSLFDKINLEPVAEMGDLDGFDDNTVMAETSANARVTAAVQVLTDPGDELQASHPLRDAKVIVEDIEDNPGFFRVRLFAIPHFQVEGMDVNLSLVSQMQKAKS